MDVSLGGRHHYAQYVLELAVALNCRLLMLHPHLLPRPNQNLTAHLRWACMLSRFCWRCAEPSCRQALSCLGVLLAALTLPEVPCWQAALKVEHERQG